MGGGGQEMENRSSGSTWFLEEVRRREWRSW